MIEEVKVERSKGKSKKSRVTRAITLKIKDKEEESTNEDIYKSKCNHIIVIISRFNPRKRG